MATPEETRERIKEMRERIFEKSTETSVKNDSQKTPQKSDAKKNKTKNLQSNDAQYNEVEPLSSLEDVPTEIIQQKNNKASSLGSEIRNISLDEKNKDSILEIELKNRFEQNLAESNTRIKKVEDFLMTVLRKHPRSIWL